MDWTHTRLNSPIEQVTIQTLFMGEHADQALIAAQRELAEKWLAVLQTALDQKLGIGKAVSVADFALATTLALHEMCGGEFSKYPAIQTWLKKIQARPSFAATAPKPA